MVLTLSCSSFSSSSNSSFSSRVCSRLKNVNEIFIVSQLSGKTERCEVEEIIAFYIFKQGTDQRSYQHLFFMAKTLLLLNIIFLAHFQLRTNMWRILTPQ